MTSIRVFYEDQATAGALKEFGPHVLLCSCVADRIPSVTLWELRKRIDGQPKKGVDKLLAACERHAQRGRGEVVFAVFDGDRVHERLDMPRGSTSESLVEALAERIGSARVRPFVLPKAIEQLVEAAAGCLEPPVEGLIPKSTNERDRILNRAATRPSRSTRDCITDRIPMLGELADAIAEQVRSSRSEALARG